MDNIKQINTGVAELLAVKAPEKSGWFETRPGQGIAPPVLVYNFGPSKFMSEVVHLPPGNCTPLGLSTELTEEQCREVVEPRWDYYKNYLTVDDGTVGNYKRFVCYTAKEAFASLMQANGCYSVNPLGEKPNRVMDKAPFGFESTIESLNKLADTLIQKWQQAEANTGTWLILKRLS